MPNPIRSVVPVALPVWATIWLKTGGSIAVNGVYVVDEIQFQSAGKMTIKVTPRDR